MSLPLNIAILGAEDPAAAQEFYTAVLAPRVQDYGGFSRLGLHGAGDLGGLIRKRFSIWLWERACPRFGRALAKRRIAAKAAATQERVCNAL